MLVALSRNGECVSVLELVCVLVCECVLGGKEKFVCWCVCWVFFVTFHASWSAHGLPEIFTILCFLSVSILQAWLINR